MQGFMDEALADADGRLDGRMRGNFVTIAVQGDFGKARPALVIQADQFGEHATVTVLPATSTLVAAPLFRITVEPNAEQRLGEAGRE